MKSMHLLLDEAETMWRSQVRRDFPLYGNTQVVRTRRHRDKDWTFSTDLRKIFADISDDQSLQSKFDNIVSKYWEGSPEEIAKETLHYLLYHEIYHSLEAPSSTRQSTGNSDNDNTKIHQSIRRGILKAEPNLSPKEIMTKVAASQNGVKDFILDNRFYLDNQEEEYVREDIVPVWDVLELHEEDPKTNFYTVTRLAYGLLYGPESTNKFFDEKAGKKGRTILEKALTELIGKGVKLPKQKSLVEKVSTVILGEDKPDSESFAQNIRSVFSGNDRYAGIERLMSVLGPYVELGMPQGRPILQGSGAGVSTQDLLQDLLDDMTPEEQASFAEGLANEKGLEGEGTFSDGQANSITNYDSSDQQLHNVDVLAMHEFYKRNHPSISIVGGSSLGKKVVTGKQDYWSLKNSRVITEDQLSRINLQKIDNLQRKTRLPWIIPLSNRTFKLNEYELRQKDVHDIVYVDDQIDVPDVVELYLDSSGSMFKDSELGFNDESRMDMLYNVTYGFVDGLQQAGKRIGKTTRLRFHNFAESQKDSPLISIDKFLRGHPATLKTIFKPNNGYNVEDINLTPHYDNQKRAYVVATDGNLVISDRANRESRKMKEIAKHPNNSIVLFEIGGGYDLGNAVKSDPNISYYPIYDKNTMLQAGLEVLLGR
jgi:hypothetical protein